MDESTILAPDGTLAKKASKACPRCGSGPERRVPSAGFGVPHPVCTKCGHEFLGERA